MLDDAILCLHSYFGMLGAGRWVRGYVFCYFPSETKGGCDMPHSNTQPTYRMPWTRCFVHGNCQGRSTDPSPNARKHGERYDLICASVLCELPRVTRRRLAEEHRSPVKASRRYAEP